MRGTFIEFESVLDGAPCVMVFTGSANRKTGTMVQTWIMRADMDPVAASRAMADRSICGDCPHRHSLGGACYVAIGRAPISVWKAYKRGSYRPFSTVNAKRMIGMPLRCGAYGDPVLVPLSIWREVFDVLKPKVWTSYTHQWRLPLAQAFRSFTCASVDSPSEYATARAMGWKPFRTMAPGSTLIPGEFACPASEEQGKRLTCMECGACNGNPHGKARVGSAAIVLHGFKVRKPKLIQVETL